LKATVWESFAWDVNLEAHARLMKNVALEVTESDLLPDFPPFRM